MKRSILILFIIILSATLLTSCGKGVSTKETKEQTKLFIEALIDGDSAAAAEYLHPSVESKSEEGINDFLSSLKDQGIVLTGEITSFKTFSFNTSVYSSDYKGSSCEIGAKVKIGDEKYIITSNVVRNDDGYGIYAFEIEKDE